MKALLDAPAPYFVDSVEAGAAVTPLVNVGGNPASEASLEWLRVNVAGAGDLLLELYARWDGLRLFANRDDEEECFFFLPIQAMPAQKQQLQEWMLIGDDGECGEEGCVDDGSLEITGIPDWWPQAVVFAGFGYSPERLFLATSGPYRGGVFVFEHDGGYSRLVAPDLASLLTLLADDPASFMREYFGVGYFDVQTYVGQGGECLPPVSRDEFRRMSRISD